MSSFPSLISLASGYGDFPTPHAQAERVLGFIRHWNQRERHPFRWTWRTDRLQNRRTAA